MKINPVFFAIASGITAAILWLVCSLFVAMMPAMMMDMSGQMVHANLGGMNWSLSFGGVIAGLIGWAVFAAIFAWILAFLYNMLIKE